MNFSALRKFMDSMAETRTPGTAVKIYCNGQSVFEYACGYSNLEEKKPLTGKELFNIYSCSKLVTVTAGAQLLEQGKFLLTDPLHEYIPEFRNMKIKNEAGEIKPAERSITIGDLFTMTAGFSYDLKAPGFQKANLITNGKMDTVETIRCVADDPILFEPGTKWNYSICHDILAALISVVSGQKFRDYVQQYIFDPLGMQESYYHHTAETLTRTAEQYEFMDSNAGQRDIVDAQIHGSSSEGVFVNIGKQNSLVLGEEYDSGGAGIITSISDYTSFLAALANYGLGLTGERILSPYTVDLIKTNRLTADLLPYYNWPQLAGCGYGLGVRTHSFPEKSGLIAGRNEFGWGGAAGASAIVDPEINLAVFYVQHTLNPREEFYQPRLRNLVYKCLA